MAKRKSGSYAERGMAAMKRMRASGGFTAKRRKAARVNTIKKTILGLSETKREYLHTGVDGFYHDAGDGVATVGGFGHPSNTAGNNMLGTVVGDAKNQREGDQIYSKYIDYAFQLQCVADRSNQQCRFLIVKGTGNNANDYNSSSIADWFVTDGTSGGSGNLLVQPVDRTKYTVLKDIIVTPIKFGNNQLSMAANGDDLNYPIIRGRLKTGYKVQYKTGSTYPSKSSHRIQWAIIPYCNFGTGVTDLALQATMDMCHYFCDM